MEFSVIIPCFNCERFLPMALDSLKNQSFSDFEAIVVNDGSADNSSAIAHRYESEDPRFTVIDQENRGLPAARNAAIAVASGKLLAFLDADDTFHEEFLQRHHEFHESQPADVDAAVGRFVYIDPDNRPLYPYSFGIPRPLTKADMKACPFPPVTVTCKRSRIDAVDGFDESFRVAEDVELWIRLLDTGLQFLPLTSALAGYRLHAGSIMSRQIKDYLRATCRLQDRLQDHVSTDEWSTSLAGRLMVMAGQQIARKTSPVQCAKSIAGLKVPDLSPQAVADDLVLGLTKGFLLPWSEWIDQLDDREINRFLLDCGFIPDLTERVVQLIKSYMGAFDYETSVLIKKNWPRQSKLAIFGAGRNAIRLLETLKALDLPPDNQSISFIDECPSYATDLGPVYSPEKVRELQLGVIVLSSPNHRRAVLQRCKVLFPDIQTIDVFA